MSSNPYKINPDIDAIIRQAGNRADAAGAVELALVANRAVSELHKVARKIANENREPPIGGAGQVLSTPRATRSCGLRPAARPPASSHNKRLSPRMTTNSTMPSGVS